MKKLNKTILSFIINTKSKLLIIYSEYISSFFIIFFVLFAIFLIIYYSFLFITSSQKDKLANLTTILSFVVGFLAIKYQINRDFMKKEEESIFEIINQLDLIQRKSKQIEKNTEFFEKFYIRDNPQERKIRRLNAIQKLILEQIETIYKTDKLIVEHRNRIIPKKSYFKITVLDGILKNTHENINNYLILLSNLNNALFNIESELLNLESMVNKDRNNFYKKISNLQKARENLKSCLQDENDKKLLYNFLQKYNK